MPNDPIAAIDTQSMQQEIIKVLRTVYDPEIPVNIYDLGLIYNIAVNEQGGVELQMTLTTPGCPVAATFPGTVEANVRTVDGVTDVNVELVWDPPWTQANMSEAAKLHLGLL